MTKFEKRDRLEIEYADVVAPTKRAAAMPRLFSINPKS
jgi:hypothetical protein